MSFQKQPSGWVVLWRIGSRTFSAKIRDVNGYDIATGTWSVDVEYQDRLGQGSLRVNVEREAGTSDWVLAHTDDQRPAHNRTESAGQPQGEPK